MEFNKKQIEAIEIYLKSKDKLLNDPNYVLSPNEIQAKFMVEHDEMIQEFLSDPEIQKNESIYSTMYIKNIDLNKKTSIAPQTQMGYANVILMSIIVIILVSIICVFIFL